MSSCYGTTAQKNLCNCSVFQQEIRNYTGVATYDKFKSVCPVATCLHTSALHDVSHPRVKGINYPFEYTTRSICDFLGIKNSKYIYVKSFNKSFTFDQKGVGDSLEIWRYSSGANNKSILLKILLLLLDITRNNSLKTLNISTRELLREIEFTDTDKKLEINESQLKNKQEDEEKEEEDNNTCCDIL